VVTHDLEHDDPRRSARHLKHAESVVFAAGVHHGAALDQLKAVDRGGAVAALAAAREVGASRFPFSAAARPLRRYFPPERQAAKRARSAHTGDALMERQIPVPTRERVDWNRFAATRMV
jgi:hypothetical protein